MWVKVSHFQRGREGAEGRKIFWPCYQWSMLYGYYWSLFMILIIFVFLSITSITHSLMRMNHPYPNELWKQSGQWAITSTVRTLMVTISHIAIQDSQGYCTNSDQYCPYSIDCYTHSKHWFPVNFFSRTVIVPVPNSDHRYFFSPCGLEKHGWTIGFQTKSMVFCVWQPAELLPFENFKMQWRVMGFGPRI